MKYTLDKIVRNFALGGLAATIIACGGGNPPVLASEADGRAQIRVKLVADMNAGRIADWEEDPDFEPEPGKPVFADFKVTMGKLRLQRYNCSIITAGTTCTQALQALLL